MLIRVVPLRGTAECRCRNISRSPSIMSSRFSLRIISGDQAGEVCHLEGHRLTVGRKPGNTLQLKDASISGSHAELILSDGAVILRDRNSTNGTRVAGAAVDPRAGLDGLCTHRCVTHTKNSCEAFGDPHCDTAAGLSARVLRAADPLPPGGTMTVIPTQSGRAALAGRPDLHREQKSATCHRIPKWAGSFSLLEQTHGLFPDFS